MTFLHLAASGALLLSVSALAQAPAPTGGTAAERFKTLMISLDSHLSYRIFYPTWWVDEQGHHPAPHTVIDSAAVRAGKFKPLREVAWSLSYVEELEQKAKTVRSLAIASEIARARLALRDPAQVWLDAYPGDTLKAEVSEIAEVADPLTGTFSVKLRIEAGERRLASGLVARLQLFPSRKTQVGLVPIEAVTGADRNEATLFSLKADGKTVEARSVQVAHILPDRVAIRPESEPVHTVVTDGASYLHDGETVTVLR